MTLNVITFRNPTPHGGPGPNNKGRHSRCQGSNVFGLLLWTVVILTMFSGGSWAVASAADDAIDTTVYRIQTGDVLSVVVYSQPDLSYDVPVLSDGTISYPFLGRENVVDWTLADVEETIAAVLEAYVRFPVVSVTVRPAKAPAVILLGEVGAPGVYPMPTGPARLLEMIALAGGPTPDADLSAVKVYESANIRHFDEAPIGVDGVLFEGDYTANPRLEPGAIVYVPAVEEDVLTEVYVLGAVARPGAYPIDLRRETRLLEVIARAGGLTKEAIPEQVRVYDGGEVTDFRSAPVGTEKLLFEGDQWENVVVHAGNVVFVPERLVAAQVTVIGPVLRPGDYDIEEGTRLLKVIGMAGGFTADADASNVVLRRESGDGEVTITTVDMNRALVGDEPGADAVLQDGDVIVVQPVIQVAVAGAVRNSGVFRLRSNARLSDAILAAGGTLEQADEMHVRVTRAVSQAQHVLEVDYRAAVQGGENPSLREGDIVFVPRSERIAYVTGEVNAPGAYTLREQMRLVELLATAGGPTREADTDHIVIHDGNGDQVFAGALSQNPYVLPEQTVTVSGTTVPVTVIGGTGRTGRVDVPRNSRILDVIGIVGGQLNPETSSWHQVQLLRETETDVELHVIDVAALLQSPEPGKNIPVHEDDVIFVPAKSTRQVSILGEVARPGVYALSDDARIIDALAAAGGAANKAALEKVAVMASGEALEPQEVYLGRQDRFAPDGVSDNVYLEDGAVIVVPRSNRLDWQDLISILGGVKLIKEVFAIP